MCVCVSVTGPYEKQGGGLLSVSDPIREMGGGGGGMIAYRGARDIVH